MLKTGDLVRVFSIDNDDYGRIGVVAELIDADPSNWMFTEFGVYSVLVNIYQPSELRPQYTKFPHDELQIIERRTFGAMKEDFGFYGTSDEDGRFVEMEWKIPPRELAGQMVNAWNQSHKTGHFYADYHTVYVLTGESTLGPMRHQWHNRRHCFPF